MSQDTFRRALQALLGEFLAEGGDAFWLAREISLASMQVFDDLRCDLALAEEAEDEPPW